MKKKNIGGAMVTQILTIADESTDDRHLDRDYWHIDGSGQLLFYGFFKAVDSSSMPSQEVIFDQPLILGSRDMTVGATFSGSVTASNVIAEVPGFGSQTVTATIAYSVEYKPFIPTYPTPLATFHDVMHLTLMIKVTSVRYLFVDIPVNIAVNESEFFFNEGLGMIAQDQNADPNDALIQAIDGGMVGALKILADGTLEEVSTASRHWHLYDIGA